MSVREIISEHKGWIGWPLLQGPSSYVLHFAEADEEITILEDGCRTTIRSKSGDHIVQNIDVLIVRRPSTPLKGR